MEIIINPKFQDLLPPLADEEYKQLEASILEEGVRESIKLWRNQIVDGHNRYSICLKHDLAYNVKDMFFADEDEVLEWIYINQLGRRNLSDFMRTHYIGKLYNLRKNRHGGDRKSEEIKGQSLHLDSEDSDKSSRHDDDLISEEGKRTAEVIAEEFNISPRTVERAGKVAEILDDEPELKEEFFAGKITQKQVIESVKETTETTVDFLAGKIHSEKLLSKIRALADAIGNAERAFAANGLDLGDYAPRIVKFNRKAYEQQAKEIAEIRGK